MAKILIIEDDVQYGSSTKRCLEVEGHVVEHVLDGEQALSFLEQYSFDLLILDWQLPIVSGIEVCRSYRERGGNAPILMLTARTGTDNVADGLNCGADDYVEKPVHPTVLSARVKALLRRPANLITNVVSIKHVSIDRTHRKVTVNGGEVELLPREYSLLEFLMTNPNRTFSADELVDAIWPSTVNAVLDTVRGTVKRLRKKIDVDGQPSLIRSIYGVGYTIDSP